MKDPASAFPQNIADTIARHSLLPRGAKVMVALSGGSDSVALLLSLRALGYDVSAAHFNFRLRGVESLRDEQFVRTLCNRLGIVLHVESQNARAYAAAHGVSIEMAAREMRYGFFASLVSATSIPVAVAHHADDNIETVFLSLLRGTGLRGLTGMRYRAVMTFGGCPVTVIRPMLDVSRADVLAYLSAIGQDYVTDSTNQEDDVKRNMIRLDVLPSLCRINPSYRETLRGDIYRFSEMYKIYAEAVRGYLRHVTTGPYGDRLLSKNVLRSCPSPEALLYEWLSPYGFHSAQIHDMLLSRTAFPRRYLPAENKGGGEFVLYEEQNRFVLCDDRSLADIPPMTLPESGCCRYGELAIEVSELHDMPSHEELRNPACAFIDIDKLCGPLAIRRIKSGDRMRPFGMKGTKLVNDIMAAQKAGVVDRLRQTVVVSGDIIVWLTGRRTAADVAVSVDTRHILRLSIIG